MKTLVAIALAATLASTSAFAWSTGGDCGCTPTHTTKKVKVNSGVGNGAEFGPTEANDRDPGNSGAHNQAGKNSFKPNSARAGTSIP